MMTQMAESLSDSAKKVMSSLDELLRLVKIQDLYAALKEIRNGHGRGSEEEAIADAYESLMRSRMGDPSLALERVDEHLQSSVGAEGKPLRSFLLYIKAKILFEAARTRDAYQVALQARRAAVVQENDHIAKLATLAIADCLNELRQLTAADRELQSLAVSQQDTPAIRIRWMLSSGKLAARRMDLDEAEAMFQQTCELAESYDDIDLKARGAGNLGLTRMWQGQFDAAAEPMSRALEMLRKVSNRRAIIITETQFAWLDFLRGEDAAASKLQDQVERQVDLMDSDLLKMMVYTNRMAMAYWSGSFAKVKNLFSTIRPMMDKDQVHNYIAKAAFLAGCMELEHGNPDAAFSIWRGSMSSAGLAKKSHHLDVLRATTEMHQAMMTGTSPENYPIEDVVSQLAHGMRGAMAWVLALWLVRMNQPLEGSQAVTVLSRVAPTENPRMLQALERLKA